jgi:hypothetical protein
VDDRIQLFLHITLGVCSFGLLGAVFGGLAAAWFHSSGKAAGVFGPWLLQVCERVLGTLPPMMRAVLGGTTDGAVFLGVLGGGVGVWADLWGIGLVGVLTIASAAALLALGAVLFGGLGYFLVRIGARATGTVLVGAMTGGCVGAWWGPDVVGILGGLLGVRLSGSDPMFLALVGGAILGGGVGGCVALLGRRDQDSDQKPN